MKRKMVAALFVLVFCFCSCEKEKPTQWFAMIYRPGPNWNYEKEASEQSYFLAHTRHLSRLRKSGSIPIGGRYEDMGFMLLKTKDMGTAEGILRQDSSIVNGTFNAFLHRFQPFYYGCMEEPKREKD